MSSLTNYPALYNNSNTNASSSLSSPESKKSSSPPQITDPLSSLSCSEFPNIELLKNKNCHAIVGNETVLELVIRPNMLRNGQSAGNIFNVEIPLTSLTNRKLPLGIVEKNKLIAKFMNGMDEDIIHKFHKSWDWLMPVVEKIENLEDYRFDIIIRQETVIILDKNYNEES